MRGGAAAAHDGGCGLRAAAALVRTVGRGSAQGQPPAAGRQVACRRPRARPSSRSESVGLTRAVAAPSRPVRLVDFWSLRAVGSCWPCHGACNFRGDHGKLSPPTCRSLRCADLARCASMRFTSSHQRRRRNRLDAGSHGRSLSQARRPHPARRAHLAHFGALFAPSQPSCLLLHRHPSSCRPSGTPIPRRRTGRRRGQWSLGRSCPGVARTGCPPLDALVLGLVHLGPGDLVRGPTRRRPPRRSATTSSRRSSLRRACGLDSAEHFQGLPTVASIVIARVDGLLRFVQCFLLPRLWAQPI